MRPRKLALIGFLTVTSSTLLSNTPAPRKSPEFSFSEPAGKQTLLSSFKGKVVVMEFLFMNSEHCLRVAKTLNRLQGDLGQRGFQSVGVVFGPNADEQRVVYLVDYFKLAYPVGYTTPAKVDSFLGRAGNEVLSIPQVVVIDRAGTIRAASGGGRGDPKLENESYLRDLIDGLLKEDLPATSARKKVTPQSK
jgi:peroxiredoxin